MIFITPLGVALCAPPSWLTASRKHPCSSGVHRSRGLFEIGLPGVLPYCKPHADPCSCPGCSTGLTTGASLTRSLGSWPQSTARRLFQQSANEPGSVQESNSESGRCLVVAEFTGTWGSLDWEVSSEKLRSSCRDSEGCLHSEEEMAEWEEVAGRVMEIALGLRDCE